MERLPRHPLLKAAARGRAITRHLYNVYYDTPEFALRSDKVALRLRRDGAKWTQTLKTAGRVEGGLHLRQEHDTPVPAQLLNYHALAQSGASAVFNDAELRASCKRCSSPTSNDPRATSKPPPAHSSNFASTPAASPPAQHGSNQRSRTRTKDGTAGDLLDFARQLLQQVPMRLEPRARPNAAMRSRRRLTRPRRNRALRYCMPDMSVTDASASGVELPRLICRPTNGVFCSVTTTSICTRRAWRYGACAAFQRVRPCPSARGLRGAARELRWLGSYLGPARDWDVFATQSLAHAEYRLPARTWAALANGDDRCAKSAMLTGARAKPSPPCATPRCYWMSLLRYIGSHGRPSGTRPLQTNGPDPCQNSPRAILTRHHRKVIKSGREHAELDTAALHALADSGKEAALRGGFPFQPLRTEGDTRLRRSVGRIAGVAGKPERCRYRRAAVRTLRDDTQDASEPEVLGVARGGRRSRPGLHRASTGCVEAVPPVRPFWKGKE